MFLDPDHPDHNYQMMIKYREKAIHFIDEMLIWKTKYEKLEKECNRAKFRVVGSDSGK